MSHGTILLYTALVRSLPESHRRAPFTGMLFMPSTAYEECGHTRRSLRQAEEPPNNTPVPANEIGDQKLLVDYRLKRPHQQPRSQASNCAWRCHQVASAHSPHGPAPPTAAPPQHPPVCAPPPPITSSTPDSMNTATPPSLPAPPRSSSLLEATCLARHTPAQPSAVQQYGMP